MRFFSRSKATKTAPYAIQLDSCEDVSILSACHTAQTTTIVALCALMVLFVAGRGYFAKIPPTIVGFIPIDVIGFWLGPPVGHIQECKAMSEVISAVDTNYPIAVMHASGFLSDFTASRTTFTPRKDSGLRVIREKFAQSLCSYKVFHTGHYTKVVRSGQLWTI